jgi:hypothetical protein
MTPPPPPVSRVQLPEIWRKKISAFFWPELKSELKHLTSKLESLKCLIQYIVQSLHILDSRKRFRAKLLLIKWDQQRNSQSMMEEFDPSWIIENLRFTAFNIPLIGGVEPEFVNVDVARKRFQGIDFKESIRQPMTPGELVQKIELTYQPARLQTLAELIPGLLNCLQIRAL